MRRLFAIIPSSRNWKLALLLGAFVGALAATGFGAYAAASGGNTINACATKANGQLRISPEGKCLPSEQAIQWNQTGPPGPPGPPGNTDSTVRHISNFMFDGTTVTTPILAAKGEVGKLSLFCGSAPDGSNKGVGHITYTTDNTSASFRDAVTFYSPNVPIPATWQQVNGQATFLWNEPPGDSVVFEMMIEGQIDANNTVRPTLTNIHGFIQHFAFGGCNYYIHVDTSDVASPETFTP